MLDSLLELAKKGHVATVRNLKFETKKRIFDNIYTMTEELCLDKVPDFEIRAKMRHNLIQKFPDTVFWDYAECANVLSDKRKITVPDFEKFSVCKVSTRGDVVIFNKIRKLLVYTATNNNRYGTSILNYSERTHHRLIASTFIPRPDRLSRIPYKYLNVNHIDSIKGNCAMSNLEWVTDKENQRHRYSVERYQDEKFFLFTVTVDNGFLGREFVLSEHDLHIFNLNFTSIRKIISNIIGSIYKGHRIEEIHKEDIKNRFIGFPDDIAELFKKDIRYFSVRIQPVIGTVLKGKYKDLQFSLFGGTEMNEYFNRGNIEAIVRDNRCLTHKGCAFRYATHKEAIPLHGKLTKEIAASTCQR